MSNRLGKGHTNIRIGVNELTFGLLVAAILLYGAVLWSANGPHVEKTDFSLTYVGARIVHQGMGSRLYDIDLQKRVRDSLFVHPNPLFFEHPPFEALLFSPLAALPFRPAYLIWGIFNATLFLLLIFFMRRHLPAPREDLGYVALWILFAPAGVAIFQGQPSLLLLGVYCAVFVLLSRQHDTGAGAALGCGFFRFQFVVPFLLIFILRKRWRVLGGFSITAIALGMLSLFTTGWHGVLSYIQFLLAIGGHPEDQSYGSAVDMPTIQGFIYALLGKFISPLQLKIIVFVISVSLLAFIAVRWGRVSAENSDRLMFAAAIPGSLLCGLHMFTHDFSPLLLALFLALSTLPSRNQLWVRNIMIATLALFWLPPIYFVLVAVHRLYLMCPLLLLFMLSAVFAAKRSAQAGSPPDRSLQVTQA